MMSKWTGNAPGVPAPGAFVFIQQKLYSAYLLCYREAKLRVFLFPFFRFEFIADKCPCHKQ